MLAILVVIDRVLRGRPGSTHRPRSGDAHKHCAAGPISGTGLPSSKRGVSMRRLALILAFSLAILLTGAPAQGFSMRFGGAGGHGFAGGRFAGYGFGHPIAPPFAGRSFFRGRRFDRFAFVVPVPIGFYGGW